MKLVNGNFLSTITEILSDCLFSQLYPGHIMPFDNGAIKLKR